MKNLKLILALLLLFTVVILPSCSATGKYPLMGGGNAMMDGAFAPNSSPVTGVTGDNYTEIIENAFINTTENATSYFSIDANTSSYPNLRSYINQGLTIYKDMVRVEDILNYFNYDYTRPEGDDILALNTSVFDNPFNSETKLLTVGLSAKEVEFTAQSNNLVFLIDTSGSMFGSDRLGLVQQAFMMLTENLNPGDRVSIVTYAGDDTIALEGATGADKARIMAVIEDLTAGGSTAGADGINTAYALAERYFIEGGNNRVILATRSEERRVGKEC